MGNQTQVQVDRRYAMEAIKDALKRQGRTQVWVVAQLTEAKVSMNRKSLNSYLNGYRRVPKHLLVEMCEMLHIPVERVTARITDTELLIRDGKGKPASNV